MSILNYIFIVIILILIVILISSYKKINYISTILEEIFEGNFNQRVRQQNHIKPLKILTININKIIERLQKINEENKRSEESRKKMISNISHDLRTPLTSMLGYLELILEDRNIDISDTLSEKQKEEYLRIVYNKGNYLYDLMEEFFQVSKLDSNDIRLEIKKVNISEIIRENIISFFNEIKKLDIKPKINIPDEDVYVLGDEKALNRIFTNLINNALKHGVKATIIGVELNYDEKNISIDIYDNGAGIPDDEINYVFDRLYTVEKSRSLNAKGSGLGLTIVKKLIEALDGKITVSSSSFEKTTFTVIFPRL
ncbi:HAMP domain-containing sensor histidine kinase [Clostridium sp. C2-6-12]|uniref:sensor histidine kinase n=1 Tax=Clostridium sp. C2-6-12 TaxID=2698832 RepID=UPI00136C472C|nr:HAMP domain-containing sensor histidine kinase [Clostridium sp. C2-6-12]